MAATYAIMASAGWQTLLAVTRRRSTTFVMFRGSCSSVTPPVHVLEVTKLAVRSSLEVKVKAYSHFDSEWKLSLDRYGAVIYSISFRLLN